MALVKSKDLKKGFHRASENRHGAHIATRQATKVVLFYRSGQLGSVVFRNTTQSCNVREIARQESLLPTWSEKQNMS